MDQCKFCHASNKINKSFMQNKKNVCLAGLYIDLKIVWQNVCCFSLVTHHLVKEEML